MRRILLMFMFFVVAGTGLMGADAPNRVDPSTKEILKMLVALDRNSNPDKDGIKKAAGRILNWLHFHPDTSVQCLCEGALSNVVAPEIRDRLIAILQDKKANQGSRYGQTWGALCAQGEIVADKQIKDFLADYDRLGSYGLFELAARARIEPDTRDFILKKLETGDREERTHAIEFIAIQLGLYENKRPCMPPSDEIRQKYIRLLAKSAQTQWENNHLAGWWLISLGEHGGHASVRAHLKNRLESAKKKGRPLDDLSGYLLNLEIISRKKFCDAWPKEETEKEKVVQAWLAWLEEQGGEKKTP